MAKKKRRTRKKSNIRQARVTKQAGGLADLFREKAAEGSMMVPPEMEIEATDIPVDTYPNIPPEEMDSVEAQQLPDEEMEEDFTAFVLNKALVPEEQE